jgi:hypothetical protein
LTTPPGAYATFGDHVAVSGNSLLVGDASAPTTVYARSAAEWSQEAQLAPAPASSLALDGDTAVIGYQGDAAFVMSRSGTTWTLRATLRPQADGYASSTFGASVSVHAGRILVGSPHYGSSVGAFLYADSPDGPHLLQAVGGFDKALNNGLGAAVALTPSGSTAIVGADSPATAFEYDVP